MKPRATWLLVVPALAIHGCGALNSTEGALGHGTFSYVCPNGQDFQCTGANENSAPLPAAIAVGASFTITYQPNGGQQTLGLRSTTPSILAGSDGHFSFVRAGSAGVIAPVAGGILDFTELTGVDILTLRMTSGQSFPDPTCAPPLGLDGGPGTDAGGPDGGPSDGGPSDGGGTGGSGGSGTGGGGTGGSGTGGGAPAGVASLGTIMLPTGNVVDVSLEPIGVASQPLAGNLAPVSNTSDATIVTVVSGSPLRLCGQSPGATFVLVTVNGQTFSIGVQVTTQP